ncbi:MAG: acyl-CoA dehydrogenase family protein, partial [Planctomycetota bacterium]
MVKYQAPDFYDLDGLLTEEERMIRDTVRDWVSDRYMPVIEEAYRVGRFPVEMVPEMGELGILGGALDHGDFPRFSQVAYGLVNQELERGDSGLRSFVSVQGG